MNERIRELMEEAGFAAPELAGRANKLTDLVIQECINAVKNTNCTHAYTTYDKQLIDATIIKSVQSITEHFK